MLLGHVERRQRSRQDALVVARIVRGVAADDDHVQAAAGAEVANTVGEAHGRGRYGLVAYVWNRVGAGVDVRVLWPDAAAGEVGDSRTQLVVTPEAQRQQRLVGYVELPAEVER